MNGLPGRISRSVLRLLIITTLPLFPALTMFGGTVADGSTTSAAATTGTGRLTCKPSTLNFGSVTLGHAKSISVNITNTGSSRLTVTKKTNDAYAFWLSNLKVPLTLNAGRSVQFHAHFHPPAIGPASGHIYLISNASNPKLTITLSGMGVGGNSLSPNPSNIGFGSVQVGKSLTRYETLTNSGTSNITLSRSTVAGSGFSINGLSLPLTLAGSDSVTFSITFAPKTSGQASGSVSVDSSASNSTLKVSLSGLGTGSGQLAVSPATMNFGNVVVGSSKSLNGTLTAIGASVTVTSDSLSSSEFILNGLTLPVTQPAGQTASFTMTFKPQTGGTATVKFSVASNASNSPAEESLSGSGTPISNATLDQYGGLTTMPSSNPSTGVFRLEKFSNKKWMFVDPANNAFFMTGIYVLDQSDAIDDMGNSYRNRTAVKYGDTGPTWGPAQVSRMQSWGFNTVGPFSSAYVTATHTNSSWPGDHSNPVKAPFIGFFNSSSYSMANQNNWGGAPVKNLLYGVSSFYTGYNPYSGVADYYDGHFDTFLGNELASDGAEIKNSAYKQYMIGVSLDDSDALFGFGAGPDFTTQPDPGHNNTHLGWLVLTMSPSQAANSAVRNLVSGGNGFVYSDTTVYSKKVLHDQLVAKYATIDALNTAWGSSYTTFDSSGTTITGESVATGNGSNLTFTKTVANTTVTKFTVQILVAGTAVGGDIGNGTLWGPNLSGTINYSTGVLNIIFASGHAPANGAAITANYAQNGWGIGSGLLDEDGRTSHQGWVGTNYTYMTNVNANVKTDLNSFLYQIAAHYLSTERAKVLEWMPGVLFLGPTTLGSWSTPSNRNVLQAAGQYVDAMVIGGGYPLSQAELDFIYQYYGDKPIYVGAYRVANADSAFFRYSGGTSGNFTTQQARGQDYYNAMVSLATGAYSANGSRPYVGTVWWQYLDNWGEKLDWGLVSLSDNAYDGHEAVSSTVTCSAPLQNHACGNEERNYGDLLTSVKNAHQQIQPAVQK